jgi:alkylation response protein AidB-like acyl-CoA dehydrogenase
MPRAGAEFVTRSATHDRDASHPIENYDRLREEGFLALTVGKEWGGSAASFVDHTIAYEALGQGCPPLRKIHGPDLTA